MLIPSLWESRGAVMDGEIYHEKRAKDFGLPIYFDLQAKIGHSKHLGGEEVTKRLAKFCQLSPNQFVLNVGSGAGNAAAYLVEEFDCRMIGIDILLRMAIGARQWVEQRGLSNILEFVSADAVELPFRENMFDVVISESVNVFIREKEQAMSEYIRVAKPGGFIGLTEAVWVKEPTTEISDIIMEATGQPILPSSVWERLLTDAGLLDMIFEKHTITMKGEARNQFALLGSSDYLRILVRAISTLAKDSESRSLIKYLSSNPRRYFDYLGYGLYVGRVPE